MVNKTELFFSLIRFSISADAPLPEGIGKDDWLDLYELAKRHALLGVLYRGIERLPHEVQPARDVAVPWFMASERIVGMNRKANVNAARLTERFTKDGMRCCVLKGQGNCTYYPDAFMRTPGDIDAWIEGDDRGIIGYIRRIMPTAVAYYHHIDAPAFGGTPVEVHYRPSFQFNFIHNRRLQKWFRECAPEQFGNIVELADGAGRIAMPTLRFNRVFQMSHIANHVLHEGIGLRQLLDYYFLLKQGFTDEDRNEYRRLMRRFGMYKMSGAVMYVLREVFGMPDEWLIVEPHERCGRMLLEEIMKAGNFGHYDERIGERDRQSKLRMNILRLKRDVRMMSYFPSECLSEPFFRLYHFFWRRRVG